MPASLRQCVFFACAFITHVTALAESETASTERYSLSVDNTGNALSGKRRILLGYQNTDWLHLKHRLIAQLGTTDDPGNSQQVSLNYRIPLADPDFSADLLGSYSETNIVSIDEFGTSEFNGIGTRIGFRVNQNLHADDGYRHRLRYAIDMKDFDNTCTGSRTGSCGSISNRPASLVYNGNRFTGAYTFNTVISIAANLPGGPHDSQAEFASARPDATREWKVARLLVNMLFPLPDNLRLRTQLTAQHTDDRLVGSEQFSVGGANSVRGYKERTLLGDRGYVATFELQGPVFSPLASSPLEVRPLAFVDHGCMGFARPVSGTEQGRCLTGMGVGLRSTWGKQAALRLDIGRAMDDISSARSADRQRRQGDLFGHFSISLQY